MNTSDTTNFNTFPYSQLPPELRLKILHEADISPSGVIVIRPTTSNMDGEGNLEAFKVYKSPMSRVWYESRIVILNSDHGTSQLDQFLTNQVRFNPALDILYFPTLKVLRLFSKIIHRAGNPELGVRRVAIGYSDQDSLDYIEAATGEAVSIYRIHFEPTVEVIYLVSSPELVLEAEGEIDPEREWLHELSNLGLRPMLVETTKKELLKNYL